MGAFNIAKGRTRTFVDNAAGAVGGAKIGILLLKSGQQADATLWDYTSVSTLLAGSGNVECDRPSYARIVLTAGNITSTVDNTNERWDGGVSADISLGNLETGNSLTKVVFYYDSTGSQPSSGLVPFDEHTVTITTDGSEVLIRAGTYWRDQ